MESSECDSSNRFELTALGLMPLDLHKTDISDVSDRLQYWVYVYFTADLQET